MESTSDELIFFVNGNEVHLKEVEPQTTLAAFLRRDLRLTGTKQSCNEGSCGACTVMVSYFEEDQNKIRHNAVTACMVPICSLHGRAVTTIEGIGNMRSGMHPVQERIAKFHGTQCGFCTPGMVMTMYTLLRNSPNPTKQEIMDNLHGNICRCTGYRPIIDAFDTFAQEGAVYDCGGNCCQRTSGESCCQNQTDSSNGGSSEGGVCFDCNTTCGQNATSNLTDTSKFIKFDSSQEPIFPPQLQVRESVGRSLSCFRGRCVTWFRPVTLEQALQIKAANLHAMLSSGCTSVVQKLKTTLEETVVIDISGLRELKGHEMKAGVLCLGTGMRIADVIALASSQQYENVKVLQSIPKALQSWGTQLRHAATLGGHIMLRKPIYDLMPLLVAGDCLLEVLSADGRRTVPLDEAFFRSPNAINTNEIVISLQIPCGKQSLQIRTFKVAKRKHQSFASVSAAVLLDVSPAIAQKIDKARIVIGGGVNYLVTPVKTQEYLRERVITDPVIQEAVRLLEAELLNPDLANLSPTQVTWAAGFLLKALQDLITNSQNKERNSAIPAFRSSQIFEINKQGAFSKLNIVGQPKAHVTGEEQATGEAVFIDDIPPTADELFVYPVLSTRACARVTSIDMTKALALPDVHGYIDYKDIPGVNFIHPACEDEELLATNMVHHVGQMICGIVGKDRDTVIRAARSVQVSYEDQKPAIFTIKESIEAKSFVGVPRMLERGDLQAGFERSDHVIEGEVTTRGQKHVYLEMLSSLALPKERDEIDIFTNTQMPHSIQMAVGDVLATDVNNVTVRVKRIGGGFGGKEVRSCTTTLLAAVAASKFRRPVRCILECADDTTMNGGRHPFLATYKVGFTNKARILALKVNLYADAGMSAETTQRVVDTVVLYGSTCYDIPAIRFEGQGCRTNFSSNGAFRGFGTPQANWIMENIILDVAANLGVEPEKIRENHLKGPLNVTPGNLTVDDSTPMRYWWECKEMAKYDRRVELIKEYNRTHRMKKRGIAIQPVMFGVGFYDKFANQGAALVHIYTDGSVLVTHGGCEMGQGLHTKIKQIASESLGVSFNKIRVCETSTQLVPNAVATASSVGTDLNGRAVHAACLTLKERIRPYQEADPAGDWKTWVKSAYRNRVSLSTAGFAQVGDGSFNFAKAKGRESVYFTCGAGCSEVEIDCLTGEHKVIRTDILMDVGRSINPAIDIGQIEGAFVQGYGYYMMEEVVHSKDGRLITNSPMSYKVPLASDLPAEFNVATTKNTANEKGIYSSRSVGEPPFLLALSAYLAAHKAVLAVRSDRGLTGNFHLEHPATPENILKACRPTN